MFPERTGKGKTETQAFNESDCRLMLTLANPLGWSDKKIACLCLNEETER